MVPRFTLVVGGTLLAATVAVAQAPKSLESMTAERDQWRLYAGQVERAWSEVGQRLAVCTYGQDALALKVKALERELAGLKKKAETP